MQPMNVALKATTQREQVELLWSDQVCRRLLNLSYLWLPPRQVLNQPWLPYLVPNVIDVINLGTCLENVPTTRTNNGHQPLYLLLSLIIIITAPLYELVNQLPPLPNVPVEHMLPSMSTRLPHPLNPT